MLSIVVPVYKEEKNIDELCARLVPVLAPLGEYEIIFALDPSPDRTEQKILAQRATNPSVKLLLFSRRFGQPAATLAGLAATKGDAVVVIDADMQDPPELITKLYEEHRRGFDVVYAQRRSREGETLVKRLVSYVGYWIINRITDVKIPPNTGDFRLMSRRVTNEVLALNEAHGFLRGLVAFVGFRQSAVLYDRDPRLHGQGNYNRWTGSLRIGMNGIICYSNYLLGMMTFAGFVLSAIAFLGAIAFVVTKVFLGFNYASGVPTLAILVLLMGGIQLMSVGILGEYVGRIYDQTKRRPLYIVDQSHGIT